jgi:hypothetical protein
MVALTERNGKDRYDLLVKILKRHATEENKTVTEILEVIADTPKGTEVWLFPPVVRGVAIEAYLANTEYRLWDNVGALNGGFFPIFDFNKGKIWVSLKTVDIDFADPAKVDSALSRMRNHIDKIAAAAKETPGMVPKLDIRVPAGTSYAGQLDELVDEGLALPIPLEIKITPFP